METYGVENTELPGTLDVVSVNGRLAQVCSPRMVTWLDNSTSENINFGDYNVRRAHTERLVTMGDYFKRYPNDLPLRKNVHWADGDDDKLKDQVTFFGWLTSK